MTMGQYPHQM